MPAVHVFGYGAVTSCGAPFQKLPLTFAAGASTVLQPRVMHCYILGLGSCAFARHYLRNHFCFLFLRVMRCFSSPGSPPTRWGTAIANGGLPHSEIRASMGICPYARLIAAYHVLRRLREPRHPSCALLSFPFLFLRKVAFDNLSFFRRHLQIYLQRVKFLFVWLTFYFAFNRFARDYLALHKCLLRLAAWLSAIACALA